MIEIPGPAGILDASHVAAAGPMGAQAVLCHPHPRYGGTRHDAVLEVIARALLEAGISVLRFNFRGVGGSAGCYDEGRGETADLLAAARWLRDAFPNDAQWAGGYSFGAWVTWQALHQGLAVERALLVAPPVGAMAFTARPASVPVDAIAGSADAFVDQPALAALPGVHNHVIDGADHFFSGHTEDLADAVRGLLPRRTRAR
jgi:uncharacterized protein